MLERRDTEYEVRVRKLVYGKNSSLKGRGKGEESDKQSRVSKHVTQADQGIAMGDKEESL